MLEALGSGLTTGIALMFVIALFGMSSEDKKRKKRYRNYRANSYKKYPDDIPMINKSPDTIQTQKSDGAYDGNLNKDFE